MPHFRAAYGEFICRTYIKYCTIFPHNKQMKYNYSEPHSQNRYFVAFLNNMLACYLLIWLFSPYKTAYLPECKHSQNAVLHGSE